MLVRLRNKMRVLGQISLLTDWLPPAGEKGDEQL